MMANNVKDIGDIAESIEVTRSLVEILLEKYMWHNADSICNKDTLKALRSGFKNKRAYDYIRDYSVIADCVRVIGERLELAAEALNAIEDSEYTMPEA